MNLSLFQLNESYPALARLAQQDFPKDQYKLSYKLSRIVQSARYELKTATDFLDRLMVKFGIDPMDQQAASVEARNAYNASAKQFMHETECTVVGDPIAFNEIAGLISVSPFDLALLDWLIIEREAQAGE